MFYILFILGILFFSYAIIQFICMYYENEYTFLNVSKTVGTLLLGILMLVITLPSLKYILFKEYDVINGECTIEISSSGRSNEADFEMMDTGDMYSFRHIPELDAYGKSIPYFCKLTVTKDHKFEIDYDIYDVQSRKLIFTSK